MFVFPSQEWCEEAVRLVNQDPEAALAADGWAGDFGIVIEAEPGRLAQPFVVHLVPEGARIGSVEYLEDADELEDLEPAYRLRAPYGTWKGLMLGQLDPVEAILKRKIQVEGNLQPLIERMRYKNIAERIFSQLQTRFIDE